MSELATERAGEEKSRKTTKQERMWTWKTQEGKGQQGCLPPPGVSGLNSRFQDAQKLLRTPTSVPYGGQPNVAPLTQEEEEDKTSILTMGDPKQNK